MRILLLGEYSNVHHTLSEGLKSLGHEVTVVSNGDGWKNYSRDIDISRPDGGKLAGIRFLLKIYHLLPQLKGYDVVQLINPIFADLKAERHFAIYRYLKKHNKCLILGAMGMDWYWVHECTYRRHLRYSDFNIGNEIRQNNSAIKERKEWIGTAKERLNKLIANECDAIVAGLYEYMSCYSPIFPEKTSYIPLPIKMTRQSDNIEHHHPIKLFIGINKERSEYKGTDIMLKSAQDVIAKYPKDITLKIAENVPFAQYQAMMNDCDAILDQLYSYTPSMNSLLAMSKGIIDIGGGEPENYDIIQEKELRPIINVQPTYESVVYELEQLVQHQEKIATLKQQSIAYVKRHHDYLKVARQYEKLYWEMIARKSLSN